jgi:hypothetical protein
MNGLHLQRLGRGYRSPDRQRQQAELQVLVGDVEGMRIMDACTLAARETVHPFDFYHTDARRRVVAGQSAEIVLETITARVRLSSNPTALLAYDDLAANLGYFR